MARIAVLLLAAALSTGAAGPAVARPGGPPPSTCASYETVVLGALDSWPESAYAHGVNDAGVVVGTYRPDDSREVAFTWSRSRGLTAIAVPGSLSSEALDVNDRGVVTGNASYPDGRARPFVYDPRTGRITDIGTLGGDSAGADAINDRGQVVGYSRTADGRYRAFLWTPRPGVMRDLGTLGGTDSYAEAVNDRGQVVGWAERADGLSAAFFWDPRGGMVDLGTASGYVSFGSGINARGDVTAWLTGPGDLTSETFAWSPRTRTLQPLAVLPGVSTESVGIADDGTIVANRFDWADGPDGRQRVVVWQPRTGCLSALEPPPARFARAAEVSGAGNVVGTVDRKQGGDTTILWLRARPRS